MKLKSNVIRCIIYCLIIGINNHLWEFISSQDTQDSKFSITSVTQLISFYKEIIGQYEKNLLRRYLSESVSFFINRLWSSNSENITNKFHYIQVAAPQQNCRVSCFISNYIFFKNLSNVIT